MRPSAIGVGERCVRHLLSRKTAAASLWGDGGRRLGDIGRACLAGVLRLRQAFLRLSNRCGAAEAPSL